MKMLVVIPTPLELDLFLKACEQLGHQAEAASAGRLPVHWFPTLDVAVAHGGLGKTQFAVQTQHLIDAFESDWVLCAGAAGALVDQLNVGDVVIATETVEHDIRNHFVKPMLPRFEGAPAIVERCRQCLPLAGEVAVHFGAVASGDEDVVSRERRDAIGQRTGALVVAWEGAGGARACQFSGKPYLEVRGVSDRADGQAAQDFRKNLPLVMSNVAKVVLSWVERDPGALWICLARPVAIRSEALRRSRSCAARQ